MKSISAQLVEYLEYLKEQGVTQIPVGEDFMQKISAPSECNVSSPSPCAPAAAAAKPVVQSMATHSAVSAAAVAPPVRREPVPSMPLQGELDTLERLAQGIARCAACPLADTRCHTVPGQGRIEPDILFIGEGPGADEDAQGLAFVGRAGQLLTKMMTAMGYSREEVFIGNIVKCRPPENRVPTEEEMASCMPWLKRQIALIRPKLIVCLGATAVKGLTGEKAGITKVRGSWREFEGIPVMLTYHPAYLLRSPWKKAEAWADLKAVMARLGRPLPPPAGGRTETAGGTAG